MGAGILLLVSGALLAYVVTGSGGPAGTDRPGAGDRSGARTTEVAYEVLGEGTADISYREAGDAEGTVRNAVLPWRKTVRLPQGATPAVSVTLGAKGGRASCGLTVAGRHVQSSTAEGVFGRGTCAGPSSDATAGTDAR
ncbi:MmpS family transport accessory protein [Streptomyces sp. NPDC003943]